MALGKPSIASIGAWVVLIAIIVYLIYIATTNVDTETSNYTKGASHTEVTYTVAPQQHIYPLGFAGCTPFVRLDNIGEKIPDAEKKVRK